MVDEISPRSGVLDCEQGGATFYEENYKFRIMNTTNIIKKYIKHMELLILANMNISTL